MAEGIARRVFAGSRQVWSAGSEPSAVNPLATAALAEIGIDISGHRSKSVAAIPLDEISMVVTLCADEVCPTLAAEVERLHWPLSDPAGIEGSADQRLDAFRGVRDEIESRLNELAKSERDGD